MARPNRWATALAIVATASAVVGATLAATGLAYPTCCRHKEIVRPDWDDELLDAFEPTAAERRAEDGGKVTVRIKDTSKATMKVVQSETTVAAAVDHVWAVILDYDNYPRIFDRMERSETTLKEGDWEHHYTIVRYPWPWGKRWVVNTIHHDRPRLKARFKRIDGTIREVEGIWELREKGRSATILRYGVRMDPGLEFIPRWVIPWATSIVVPDILRSVAKEAEIRASRKS